MLLSLFYSKCSNTRDTKNERKSYTRNFPWLPHGSGRTGSALEPRYSLILRFDTAANGRTPILRIACDRKNPIDHGNGVYGGGTGRLGTAFRPLHGVADHDDRGHGLADGRQLRDGADQRRTAR